MVLDLPLVICKTRERSHSANFLNSRVAVKVPRDDGVMVVVLDACDVDGGGFEVLESDLEDAVWLGSVVDFCAIGLDHDYVAGWWFNGVIYTCKAEDVVYGVLVYIT